MLEKKMKLSEQKFENFVRKSHKNILYVILASKKLTRSEMFGVIRLFNCDSQNLKLKSNTSLTNETNI